MVQNLTLKSLHLDEEGMKMVQLELSLSPGCLSIGVIRNGERINSRIFIENHNGSVRLFVWEEGNSQVSNRSFSTALVLAKPAIAVITDNKKWLSQSTKL